MSVIINFTSIYKTEIPLDTNQIQNAIDKYISDGKLNLKYIIFNGRKFSKVSDIQNLQDGSIIYLSTFPIITEPKILNSKMVFEENGWKNISKSKPVATLGSGDYSWFVENYINFSPEKKTMFKTILGKRINNGKDYKMNLEIYFPTIKQGHQLFFFVPDFFSIACEVVGCTIEQGYEYVSDFLTNESNPQKMLLINLVFGDYYKDEEIKEELSSNQEFMKVLNEYNKRVGLSEQISENDYKQKYLKYKNKYLKLRDAKKY
jgi:hypothetical protein